MAGTDPDADSFGAGNQSPGLPANLIGVCSRVVHNVHNSLVLFVFPVALVVGDGFRARAGNATKT